jgi:hypothetical protein
MKLNEVYNLIIRRDQNSTYKTRSSLQNLFNEYYTDAVAEKLAPLTNSQRNEAFK